MNTRENIWALVQLKLLEGFEVSVVQYWTSKNGQRRHLICFYRATGLEKSILVLRASRSNALFVTAWFPKLDGVESSGKRNEAVLLVYRYGSDPIWKTYRIRNSDKKQRATLTK